MCTEEFIPSRLLTDRNGHDSCSTGSLYAGKVAPDSPKLFFVFVELFGQILFLRVDLLRRLLGFGGALCFGLLGRWHGLGGAA
jgi:hypothetical protein